MATTKVTTDVIADATITAAKLASTTGSGAVVLATSPTLTTPTISTLTSAAATALTLQSAGTTAVTVDTSQRVGIGTTSPAEKLEVTGIAGGGELLSVTNAGSRRVSAAIGGDGRGYFYLRDNTPTTQVLLDTGGVSYFNGGNVGIGTTSPATKLHLLTPSATAVALRAGNSASYAEFQVDASGNSQLIAPGGVQIFNTNGAERARIDSSGNVGIGTASPRRALEAYSTTQNNNITMGGSNVVGIRWQTTDPNPSERNWEIVNNIDNQGALSIRVGTTQTGTPSVARVVIDSSGNVGIGTASPSYQLHVNTDSAGKPGAGGLWTVVSDERIKANIVPADLDRCYAIVKSVPLKHFGFAPGVYTDDQIHDKHNLGWIAQDVQKVFKHAVSVKPFTLKTAIPDGTEDYEEQDFTLETVEDTKVSIEILNGKPVQVSKTTSTENKVLLFDTVEVTDEAGAVVMESYEVSPAVDAVLAVEGVEAVDAVEGVEAVEAVEAADGVEAVEAVKGIEAVKGVEAINAVEGVDRIDAVMGTRPVTHQMPRMITKTRPKVRHDVIEDCLDLNSGQMIAALYGAVQALMAKVDTLEAARIA